MNSPLWAKVGAKVVCVDDIRRPFSDHYAKRLVAKGETYTLASVEYHRRGNVWACEIEEDGGEQFYALCRFRPVKTIEDDISEHFAVYLKTPVRTSVRAGERA